MTAVVGVITGGVTPIGPGHPSGRPARAECVAVGFAAGVLYRYARATLAGGIRRSPVRNLSLGLVWTALAVAVDRSTDDRGARRAFVTGFVLGAVWSHPARGGNG